MENKIGEIKYLQKEIDRRNRIEAEAEKLICQGEAEKAEELLNTLSDNLQT